MTLQALGFKENFAQFFAEDDLQGNGFYLSRLPMTEVECHLKIKTIDPKKTSSTLGKIQITIKTPGFKERVIMVPVKTALSTYLELDLEKEK